MSTDSVEPVTARKKNVRGGHKVHIRKLISRVNYLLRYTDSAENNAELLLRKLQLERKAHIISKLNEELLVEIGDEGEMAHEIETAGKIRSEIAIIIKIERERERVKHLAVTTENYEEAPQILDERYGNVEIKNNPHPSPQF